MHLTFGKVSYRLNHRYFLTSILILSKNFRPAPTTGENCGPIVLAGQCSNRAATIVQSPLLHSQCSGMNIPVTGKNDIKQEFPSIDNNKIINFNAQNLHYNQQSVMQVTNNN